MRHDKDPKIFTAAFGNQTIQPEEIVENLATKEAAIKEYDDMIEMIFAQDETARFFAGSYTGSSFTGISPEKLKHPLATTFRENDYEIEPVFRKLFASRHFYDTDTETTTDNSIGALIKSPLVIRFTGLLASLVVPGGGTCKRIKIPGFAPGILILCGLRGITVEHLIPLLTFLNDIN